MAELTLTFPELPAFDESPAAPAEQWIVTDAGRARRVDLREPGPAIPGWPTQPVTMVIPDTILSANVISEARRGKRKLPPEMADLLDRFDWHRVSLTIGIRTYPEPRGGVQGARDFGLRVRVTAGLSRDGSAVEDVGPETEWLPKGYKFETKAKLKVTTAGVGSVLRFLGKPKLPLPDASIDSTFTYVWQPQVQAVSSNLAENGHGAEWTFNRSKDRWLDGQDYDLVLLVRRERTVESLALEVAAGWIDWSVRVAPGMTTTLPATSGGTLRVPILFAASSTGPRSGPPGMAETEARAGKKAANPEAKAPAGKRASRR
jgi:hypothetical protein